MARKGSSPQIHLHTTQRRLSEGQVKMNSVHSLLAISLLLSRAPDLSVNQRIPNPMQPRRKNCLACWTLNFWGRKQTDPYRPGSDGRALSPPAETCPAGRRTTGRFYFSSPSLGGVATGEAWGQECEVGGKSRWDPLVQASNLSSYLEAGDGTKNPSGDSNRGSFTPQGTSVAGH